MFATDNVSGTNVDGSQDTQPVSFSLGVLNPMGWSFLGEPAWKWGVFVVAMTLFLGAWGSVLRYMK